MPVAPDHTPSPTGATLSSKRACVTLLSLPELERTTWRLVLHTLSVRRCTAFVKEEDDRWMGVTAQGAPSPSHEEGGIRLSLRYLTGAETETLPFLKNWHRREELGDCGVGTFRLTVPLKTAHHLRGFLQASERTVSDLFSEHDRITLQLLGRHVLSSLRSILKASEDDSPAYVDYLTHLYNYRYFCQRLRREILQAELLDQPLSLFMVDLNQYKRINDTYGHETGNLVLAQIAALLRGAVRETDVVCRYGGDEFAVILPHTDGKQALSVAHRLEEALRVAEVNIPGVGSTAIPHFSIGISTFPFPATSDAELVRQADQALYTAKRRSAPAIHSFE
jgi:diguanylate cyclase (GGDEF)-like protein